MNTLFVDLDGTLLLNDSVQELFLQLLLQKPAYAFLSLWILLIQGKTNFKSYLAKHTSIIHIKWQFNPEIILFLQKEKIRGRKIILLTASYQSVAQEIVAPLNLFDEVWGSDAQKNFKGKQKLAWIQKHYPNESFDYMGNSTDDYILWQHASEAWAVNPSKWVAYQAKKIKPNIHFIFYRPKFLAVLSSALRISHYSKNFLIFLPLLLSGGFFDLGLWKKAILNFIGFCCLTSANYLINDLLDINHDRLDSYKKLRPLAAGYLSLFFSLTLVFILFGLVIAISLFLPAACIFIFSFYLLIALAYSIRLKKIALLDLFVLSSFYIIRIFSGGLAIQKAISPWLLSFGFFFFLSLAYLKRFVEINNLNEAAQIAGRFYKKSDLDFIKISGLMVGLLSPLIFSLYLNSNSVIPIYIHPAVLWLATPILLYWINYIWFTAIQKKLKYDPLIFALTDKLSLGLGLLILLIILYAQGLL